MENYDFSGWATRANIKCTDGRVIMKDAFKHLDGKKVPLVWGHQHNDPNRVLGHAYLEHRDEGVYTYGVFNDGESGQNAKKLVQHGDVDRLSIYANQLKQDGPNVIHGMIREVSLVLAGANPGAFIDSVIMHGEESEEEAIIHSGEYIVISHVDNTKQEDTTVAEENKTSNDKTIKEVFDTFNEEQKTAVYAVVGSLLAEQADDDEEDEEDDEDINHSEGGDEIMKENIFDQSTQRADVLTHADQESIITMAKASNVGSFRTALRIYQEEHGIIQHGLDEDVALQLFPEYKDVKPGAPELLERDMTWVDAVMRKTHKSPISRIRTRQADARGADMRAHGYQKKGDEKTVSGNFKLMGRTTDPQTVYRKDSLHRDDIIDITDFDVVVYQYGIMRHNLLEDIALATMVGDLREDGDPDKIQEEHIRPIWKDDELYTIHRTIDFEAVRNEIQGTDTDKYFGENYIYAEAIVTEALYGREEYKGSGNLEFYCTPHLLNIMLLARDRDGRRMYSSKSDLEKALNVSAIHTAEQFEGLTRTDTEGKKKKLLGLFVNLADYQHGSTKGGEITKFEQFDIDFNLNKYLIETRLSGALVRIKSAIALEELVEAAG